jgi:fibronectin type 3 domain-containing protein
VAPAAPGSLQAIAGDRQVTLSWTAAATATTYGVKRGTASGGPYTLVASVPSTTFGDIDVADGTAYFYVVTAFNGASESPASLEVKATPVAPALGPGVAPPAPTALAAAPGNGQASLSWTASAGATAYNVKRSLVSGGPFALVATLSATSYVDLGLANGTPCYYIVTALNGGTESAATAAVSTTPMAPPAAPTALAATQGDGQVALAWTAGAGDATYQVGRAGTPGGPYTAAGAPVAATTFKDTGLANGTPYYYVVYALNPVGRSASSNEVAAVPIAPPTGLLAVPNNQQVGLFWASAPGAITYNVYVAAQGGGTFTKAGATATGRFLDGNLANGTARTYQVTAVNSTGESAPSAPVSATPAPSGAAQPTPDDPAKNLAGLGTWFMCDWDGSRAFVDVMKQGRSWMDAGQSKAATLDTLGWPTQDACTVLMTDEIAYVNGTFKLIFNGKATVNGMWAPCTVANQVYDAASNTTTADVTFAMTAAGSTGLVFTGTQRTATSPTGSGFTNARLYRPGYATDGSAIFTTAFLQAFKASGAKVVRMMDWGGGSSDVIQHWSDRATPASATQAGLPGINYTGPDGTTYISSTDVALEHRIQLCNTLKADFWLNIPPVADQDFITRTALTLRYGSDGTNPYTSPQAQPVYPPLDPSLKVYVEYANETWNSANGYSTFGIEMGICDHLPAAHPLRTPATSSIYTLMWRWPAYNIANISETFRGVFGGEAMMARVRPVLETQEGNGQDTLATALTWLEPYAQTLPTPRKVSDLIYGGGGSAYYGVIDASNSAPAAYLAPTNYPDPQTVAAWADDSMWTKNFGVKHIAYEGGPGPAYADAVNQAINASPLMVPYMKTMHDAWTSMGGDLCTYYCVQGPSSWEFTPDITNAAAPKLQALAAIATAPRAPVTLGTPMPGTIVVTGPTSSIQYGAYSFTGSVGGLKTLFTDSAGFSLGLPVTAQVPVSGTLTLSGVASAANAIDVYVNGVKQAGSIALPVAKTTSALTTSTSIPVVIPAGFGMIRLVITTGTLGLYSITVQ